MYDAAIEVEVSTSNHGVHCAQIRVAKRNGEVTVLIELDENHTAALVLAAQAAVAEIQARAVSR